MCSSDLSSDLLRHRALHSTGADVVAAPIGDHPAVADLVVHRYRELID